MRPFWWRHLEGGKYDVSHLRGPCVIASGLFLLLLGDFFLQLYVAGEPAVRIGQFRKHHPPEQLAVGDNYATFHFNFLHRPLLVTALIALSLNRWLDSPAVAH